MRLSDAQIRQYHEQGYLCPIRVFSAERAAACRRQLEAAETANGGPLQGAMKQKPHLLFTWLDELVRDDAVLDAVEGVIGPDILCWASSFFTKEAHDPSYVSWHQDLTYWGLEPADIVTAWIALSPSTPESGCMRVVPGSHKRDVLPHTETFAAHNLLSRGQEIQVEVDERRGQGPGRAARRDVAASRQADPRLRAPIRRTTAASASPSATCRPTCARPRAPRTAPCWCAVSMSIIISSRRRRRPRTWTKRRWPSTRR